MLKYESLRIAIKTEKDSASPPHTPQKYEIRTVQLGPFVPVIPPAYSFMRFFKGSFLLGIAVPAFGTLVLPARPPRGVNSFDYQYDRRMNPTVPAWNETTFRALATAQVSQLLPSGFDTIVIDGGWSANLIDAHGRPMPDPVQWPSSAGGKGFKPLADWTHDLGLKFGIWTLRGVAPQAIAAKSPVLGSSPPTTIDRIVYDPNTCPRTATEQRWCNCTWDVQGRGVDPDKPGAQAFYTSLVELYAGWGVDFIKMDCLYDDGSPVATFSREEELAVAAVRASERDLVLSLSPGGGMTPESAAWVAGYAGGHAPKGGTTAAAPVASAQQQQQQATMYRVTGDFHSRPLSWIDGLGEHVFVVGNLTAAFPDIIGANNTWPDLDILDLGAYSDYFGTPAAQLHATIWAMARSPLMFGGKLPIEDATTLNLVTNKDALVVNEHSTGLRVSYAGDCRCSMKGRKHGNACRPLALPNAVPCVATWWSDVGACKAVAVLNIGNSTTANVNVSFAQIGLPNGTYSVQHVYEGISEPAQTAGFRVSVPARGGSLLLVSKPGSPSCVG